MIDSYETEELVKLIDRKKDYLLKVENPQQAKYLQKEIMLLENNILPIVMRNTQILHNEVANSPVKIFEIGHGWAGSSHMQVRNDEGIKRALKELFDGDYDPWFYVHPQ